MKIVDEGYQFSLRRRRLLAGTSALSASALLGLSRASAAEPPPETKRIRLLHAPAICVAPQYLAEEMLRLEGFTDVEFIALGAATPGATSLATGRADISDVGRTQV